MGSLYRATLFCLKDSHSNGSHCLKGIILEATILKITILKAAILKAAMSKFLLATLLLVSVSVNAQEATQQQPASVANQVQDLKNTVIKLNRDLFILEEELLFPANTQVAFFVSMDVGEFFQLDTIELKIDDKTVANYLYTDRQIDALFRGGVQRLFVGNVRNGEHEVSAFFTGRGPKGRDYKRAVSYRFEKDSNAKYLELKINDSERMHQPEFTVKEWQ